MPSAIDQASELYAKAVNEWGAFRRRLARHPLTFFWGALGAGVIIGAIVKALV